MKKIPALVLCAALLLTLCGCSPSPTAVTVGSRRVDASEYAFYLSYDRLTAGVTAKSFSSDELAAARASALERITAQEVARIKCRELGLSLSDEQKQAIAEEKQAAIDTLGGKAAYLEYLNRYAMTDRLYDKLRENPLYLELLRTYVTEEMDQEQYTDEALRRYFGEHYILVKYIRISLLDDEGQPLASDLVAGQRRSANQLYASLSAGASFDEMMAEYNDDPVMTAQPDGLVISQFEVGDRLWLNKAFDLKNGELRTVITHGDGLYILKRLELSASYFEYNREYILESAKAHNFDEKLAQWESEAVVKTKRVVEKIDLANYMDYVK